MKYRIIKLWFSPRFPKKHIENILGYKPKGVKNTIRNLFRTWVVHPIKRRLAKYYLSFLQRFCGLTVIAITGSAGKTTTKEMLFSMLSLDAKTVSSFANIDPIYNIPTTILRCSTKTKYLILEMGVEYPTEMDYYLWLAHPQVGIITSVYWTHTEYLGNLAGVIKEKGKLIRALPNDGFAILNWGDINIRKMTKKTNANVIRYGTNQKDKNLDVLGSNIKILKSFKTKFDLCVNQNKIEIILPLMGSHFVDLALAASSVGSMIGLPLKKIKKGLERLKPGEHRMKPIRKNDGTIIIDDSYNANPLAVRESIKLMGNIGKNRRKVLVLGEMKELGKFKERGHRQVGKYAFETGINLLLTLGNLTKYTAFEAIKMGMPKSAIYRAQNKNDLIRKVQKIIKSGDLILVKGSRSMMMEEVVEALKH